MPSLTGIFCICEYLNTTPKDFYDVNPTNPSKAYELFTIAKVLSNEQLDNLITLTKEIKKV